MADLSGISWGNVDLGTANGGPLVDDYFSLLRIVTGNVDIAQSAFGFVGVDGEFTQDLGLRGQWVGGILEVFYAHAQAVADFESVMNQSKRRTWQLEYYEQTWPEAKLHIFEQIVPTRGALPWAMMKVYQCAWRILTP